jgi:hypothetical protein
LNVLAQPGRRLFITLVALIFTLFLILVGVVLFIADHWLDYYYRAVALLITAIVLLTLLFFAVGVGGLLITLYWGRVFPLLSKLIRFIINFLFPIIIQTGRFLGIDQERVRSSFIDVNNQLVLMKNIQVMPDEILLLAPHCLQDNECPYKITKDINNCKRCGRCRLHDLLTIKSNYGINVAVATGGTLARKYIREFRPKAVVAIACERDLSSGILDSYPLPVLGVLNRRPHGPCSETTVETELVEKSLNLLIKRR